jgi:DNA-binding XRE family transcriptional regulator
MSDQDFYFDLMTELIFHRKEKSFTQDDMARSIGVSRSQIANLEVVRARISVIQVDLWCKALGISVSEVWPK